MASGSPRELLSVGGSDDCARGGDTSSSRSLRPWLLRRTTARSRTALYRSLKTATRAREEAGSETYNAPRGPKTLPPGCGRRLWRRWPGPQVMAATGGYVAARAPLLAVSSLRGADGVDDTAVKYLLRAELKKKKKEEEEEERKQVLADEALDEKLDAEMDALMAIGPERLTSRQQTRLSAVLRERAELVERRKKRRDDEEEEEEEQEEAPQVLFWCTGTALWARVPLSLVVVLWLWTSL